jgi:uncharacterized protein (DUF433 family)
MNTQQYNKLIGLGIYTLQEASLYGYLSPNKLSRWVFGTRDCKPVIVSNLHDHQFISFYDLVQAMAINKAREFGISLSKIRDAINTAKKQYGIEFPLVYHHQLIWFANDLHIEFPDKAIVQVSGRQKGQMAIQQIAEPFMKNLHFDPQGLAFMMTPFKKYKRQIILDPQRQFGQPLVENTGYRADVLANAYNIERSFDAVASEYNINIEDVKIAVDYMRTVRNAA